MPSYVYRNNASAFLPNQLSAGATQVVLSVGDGDKFPSPTGGAVAMLVLEDRRVGSREVVRLTNRNGDTLTILRAQEGTLAQSFNAGSTISQRLTAGQLAEFESRVTQTAATISALDDRVTDVEDSVSQIAQAVLQQIYPVGSLYFSTFTTNPASILGFGTWLAYAQGRAIVGVGNNGESSWAAGDLRGLDNGVVQHQHSVGTGGRILTGQNEPDAALGVNGDLYVQVPADAEVIDGSQTTLSSLGQLLGSSGATTTGQFGNSAYTNVQPSVAVHIWRRSA